MTKKELCKACLSLAEKINTFGNNIASYKAAHIYHDHVRIYKLKGDLYQALLELENILNELQNA